MEISAAVLPAFLLVVFANGAQAQGNKLEAEGHARSINGDVATSVDFHNTSSAARKVWWLGYDGQRKLYMQLAPQESYLQPTYLTHPWLVTDAEDNGLAIYYPDSKLRQVTIE
ncbi:MAG: hypothetical protein REI12_02380 [Pedobacter sp.]|nr:hypothetical protein [Pedobacter sp.]